MFSSVCRTHNCQTLLPALCLILAQTEQPGPAVDAGEITVFIFSLPFVLCLRAPLSLFIVFPVYAFKSSLLMSH